MTSWCYKKRSGSGISLSRSTGAQPPIASLERWVTDLDQPEDADQLRRVVKLFDWTVRNLQLDRQRWIDLPQDLITESTGERIREIRYAWENLTTGHATAEERARVFILLGRQLGIPIVALAIDEDDGPQFWLTAAKIEDRLYLFDPRLGLPLPGPDGAGVASLQQVRQSPELLRQLDIEAHTYPVRSEQLQYVSALIDATPAYLSQRHAFG